MKKIFYISFFVLGVSAYAQVRNNETPSNSSANGTTAFMDASSSPLWNGKVNEGKGLVFPQANLVTITNLSAPVNGKPTSFPTRLDGMIVYNVGEGAPGINPTATPKVTRGFYYYENKTNDLNGGRWVRIGDDDSYSATPTYVAVGTFVHDGGNSAILTNMPDASEFKAIKSIIIRRIDDNGNLLGGVTATTLYSYDDVTKKAVFGQGVISTPIPAGNYEYIIQYSK